MLRIKPFAAVRPPENLASRVASVPYDVVNAEEARALAEGNPHSFLHIVRPEIDLPAGTSPYDDAVYAKARENLNQFLSHGTLIREDQPRLYLYRQVRNGQAQTGVVCCCHIDDYANNVILKHEKTRPDKEDDRTRHVQTLNANTGPVFLTYRDQPSLAALIEADLNQRPLHHFVSPDDITHTVWTVADPQPYIDAFAELPVAYVADGHHRSASAARAGAERRASNPNHTGQEEYNWFLTVLFPASELTILPYNRVIQGLNNQSPEQIIQRLKEVGSLTETTQPEPTTPGQFGISLDHHWYTLTMDPATIDQSDPVASLDISLLTDRILTPILDIGDPRTDPRLSFIGGIRGTSELENRVNAMSDPGMAIALFPTSIEQLLAVADADLMMPPKSTWFEPKLRSGLFTHDLE